MIRFRCPECEEYVEVNPSTQRVDKRDCDVGTGDDQCTQTEDQLVERAAILSVEGITNE